MYCLINSLIFYNYTIELNWKSCRTSRQPNTAIYRLPVVNLADDNILFVLEQQQNRSLSGLCFTQRRLCKRESQRKWMFVLGKRTTFTTRHQTTSRLGNRSIEYPQMFTLTDLFTAKCTFVLIWWASKFRP